MTSPTHNLKLDDRHYMQEVIVPEQAHQQTTSLLRVKQEILDSPEVKLDMEGKIFWLEVFAMFIFIYGSTCSKEYTGVDLAFFTGIMMAIPICAKQTGANLNPAVSLSQKLKSDSISTYNLVWLYFKAQVVGAVVSMIFAVVLNDVYRSPLAPISNTTGQIFRMILSEAMGVFVLIFFVLYACGPFTFIENNGAKYFYIAVFVYIGRRFAVVSGNQINLALSLSQAFVGIPQCNYLGFKYIFIWLIGDALGVFVAAQFYNYILQPTVMHLQSRKKAQQESKLLNQYGVELKNMNK